MVLASVYRAARGCHQRRPVTRSGGALPQAQRDAVIERPLRFAPRHRVQQLVQLAVESAGGILPRNIDGWRWLLLDHLNHFHLRYIAGT